MNAKEKPAVGAAGGTTDNTTGGVLVLETFYTLPTDLSTLDPTPTLAEARAEAEKAAKESERAKAAGDGARFWAARLSLLQWQRALWDLGVRPLDWRRPPPSTECEP
jgi:hypothetical protein